MKSLFRRDALSARPEATHPITAANTSKFAVAVTLLMLLLSSCNSNTNGQHADLAKARADSLHKPKVGIKVNRRYDEKGYMVGFDSTYTSYYSNISGDTAQMDS